MGRQRCSTYRLGSASEVEEDETEEEETEAADPGTAQDPRAMANTSLRVVIIVPGCEYKCEYHLYMAPSGVHAPQALP